MRRLTVSLITFSLVLLSSLMPQVRAEAEECPTYDFQKLFYDDYYPGKKWDNRSGSLTITWSANNLIILDESVVRPFSAEELGWIRSAFQSWDDALNTVSFSESTDSGQAEIVIGYVALTSAPNQPGATGYWNAWSAGNLRNKGTIKFRVSETSWFGVKNQFIHAVQHELGNVLGLGDIKPTTEFTSTQEDFWQPPFGNIPLSNFDIGIIRQLYGESTCPSTFLPTLTQSATEVKPLPSINENVEILNTRSELISEIKNRIDHLARLKPNLQPKLRIIRSNWLEIDATDPEVTFQATYKLVETAVLAIEKLPLICKKGISVKKVYGPYQKCPSGYKRA